MKSTIHTILLASFSMLLAGCGANYVTKDDCINDPREPVLVRVTLDKNNKPLVTPKEFIAYPGQEVIFMGKEDFSVDFIGISPTNPKNKKGKKKFKSKNDDVSLIISREFKDFRDEDLLTKKELIRTYEDPEILKDVADSIEMVIDKRPVVTKKYVIFNYSVSINGQILDPKGKVIKGSHQ